MYLYPYYAPYAPPPVPYFMMYDLYNMMVATYYWWFYLEVFKVMMEAWKKTFETTFKEVAKPATK